MSLPAGTIIMLPDGRIGTICWNHLDGRGGIWGRHTWLNELRDVGFDERFPCPEFMLREKAVEHLLQRNNPEKGIECVGTEFEVIA